MKILKQHFLDNNFVLNLFSELTVIGLDEGRRKKKGTWENRGDTMQEKLEERDKDPESLSSLLLKKFQKDSLEKEGYKERRVISEMKVTRENFSCT